MHSSIVRYDHLTLCLMQQSNNFKQILYLHNNVPRFIDRKFAKYELP